MRTLVWINAALSVMQAERDYQRMPHNELASYLYVRAQRTKARLDRHFFKVSTRV
jgi:hypothetical protein